MNKKLRLLFLSLLISFSGFAQSTWFELGLSKTLVKNLKLEFNPELRFLNDFKMDSYILEGGLSYKLHKYLTVASYYRYEDEYKYKKKSGDYKGEESINRLAFDAKSGIDFSRFNLSGRLRYTKGIDKGSDDQEFRFRTKLDYDIKGLKLVPYISVEVFHDLSVLQADRDNISGGMKCIDRYRYTTGLSYTLNKNNELSMYYRIQDKRDYKDNGGKYSSTNIIGLGFSHDF